MGHEETERLTLDRTLEALEQETGLNATVLQWQPQVRIHDREPDAFIEVRGPNGVQQFAAEIKNNVDRFEMLHHLRAVWPHHTRQPLLLIAPYITPQIAARCRDMDLCFADTAGNVYLRAPGLHVYVAGKRKPQELNAADEGGRAITPAGLRIVFVLLCQPQLLNATYRDVATTARVALGTVGPVIKDLETRRHITPAPEHATLRRRFIEAERLLEEWVGLFPTVLRPKLNVRRFRGQRPNWTEGVTLDPYGAYWGGEVAANRLLHHLHPQAATIYVRETPTRLIVDHRLKADVNGDTEILDLFWNPERLWGIRDVVPPILAYADLFTTTDGRDLEAAKMIYDEYIRPTFRNKT